MLALLIAAPLAAQQTDDSAVRSGSAFNPEIALILDVAAAAFNQTDTLQVGAHDPSSNGFNLQQLELHMGASVDPYFRMDANLVFALFGVELEEAYATSLGLPGGLQVRIGQFLYRVGRSNPTHPHTWDFVNQALLNGKFFGGEGSRGLGVETSWLMPLPWYSESFVSIGTATGECCARSFYGGDAMDVRSPADLLVTAGLKNFWALSSAWGLQWTTTGQFGPNASGANARTTILTADIHLRWRPPTSTRRTAVTLTSEWMLRGRQLPGESLRDWGTTTALVWDVTPIWQLGGRFEYVSGVEDDPLDPEWVSDRMRGSLQVTARPSHFSRFRLQGSYDTPRWADKPVYGGVLAVEFLIGAHGAHEY